jgi:hypothetical protein
MVVGRNGRESTIRNALSQPEQFSLTLPEANDIQEEISGIIAARWEEAAGQAGLSRQESRILRQATVLSPVCFY